MRYFAMVSVASVYERVDECDDSQYKFASSIVFNMNACVVWCVCDVRTQVDEGEEKVAKKEKRKKKRERERDAKK